MPVRRMRVPEEIVHQIRGFIASGELRPDDQLRIGTFGHTIEISRRYTQPLRDKLGW